MSGQAVIRPYKAGEDDQRLARFTIGKARMEGLAVANRKSQYILRPRYTHATLIPTQRTFIHSSWLLGQLWLPFLSNTLAGGRSLNYLGGRI